MFLHSWLIFLGEACEFINFAWPLQNTNLALLLNMVSVKFEEKVFVASNNTFWGMWFKCL